MTSNTRTTRSAEARELRKAILKEIASQPNPHAERQRCSVWECTNPTQRASGDGLSLRLCRKHVRQLSRHGSAHRSSYSGPELRGYLWAAKRWLKANTNTPAVRNAIDELGWLIVSAPSKPEIATRMRRTTAAARARNALARLRASNVKPERLAAIVLATHALAADDWSFSADNEFLTVQIAKQAHRLAGRWTPPAMRGRKSPPGARLKFGHEVYSLSTGTVLRVLGRQINEAGRAMVGLGVEPVKAMAIERLGPHKSHEGFEFKTSNLPH